MIRDERENIRKSASSIAARRAKANFMQIDDVRVSRRARNESSQIYVSPEPLEAFVRLIAASGHCLARNSREPHVP